MAAEQDNPILPALERLEAALSRLETAVRRPNGDSVALLELRARHDALSASHAALRARVGNALGQIDGLLGELEGHD